MERKGEDTKGGEDKTGKEMRKGERKGVKRGEPNMGRGEDIKGYRKGD